MQVIGHQWWWEFRYPQYTSTEAGGRIDTVTTANELYLPVGRKVSFSLTSQDVIHSFSIPQLAGKRDLMANRTNYLWFTPDSVSENAWNGFCAEFCGASHANMHFKVLTVTPANFESWVAHQKTVAAFGAVTTPAAAPVAAPAAAAAVGAAVGAAPDTTSTTKVRQETPTAPKGGSQLAATPTTGSGGASPATAPMAGHDMSAMATAPVVQAGFVNFPREKMPAHTVPKTPLPVGLAFNESLKGDPERGRDFITKMGGGCVGCHRINGNPVTPDAPLPCDGVGRVQVCRPG